MEVIDFHTHLWPDKVAEKAKEFLEASYRRPMAALPTVDNAIAVNSHIGIVKQIALADCMKHDYHKHGEQPQKFHICVSFFYSLFAHNSCLILSLTSMSVPT